MVSSGAGMCLCLLAAFCVGSMLTWRRHSGSQHVPNERGKAGVDAPRGLDMARPEASCRGVHSKLRSTRG
eukprot:1956741-Rhodomonas_salina.1